MKNLFHRKHTLSPTPLRVAGVGYAPITPEADEAEVATQAILELMLEKQKDKKFLKRFHLSRLLHKEHKKTANESHEGHESDKDSQTVAYYEHLAKHVGEAYHAGRQRALRFICFAEQQLDNPNLPAYGHGSLAMLEAELYKRLDVVDREGGDMKKRWQHCLAEITLRIMNAPLPDEDEEEKNND